jgi:hypothetical protein
MYSFPITDPRSFGFWRYNPVGPCGRIQATSVLPSASSKVSETSYLVVAVDDGHEASGIRAIRGEDARALRDGLQVETEPVLFHLA